jgi:hypothetical protein
MATYASAIYWLLAVACVYGAIWILAGRGEL